MKVGRSNQITGPNAGGPRQIPILTTLAARSNRSSSDLTKPQRHSVHGEPNEPDLALSGVGGHSIHGLEDLEGIAHRSMVVDRFGLRIGGDEQITPSISTQS